MRGIKLSMLLFALMLFVGQNAVAQKKVDRNKKEVTTTKVRKKTGKEEGAGMKEAVAKKKRTSSKEAKRDRARRIRAIAEKNRRRTKPSESNKNRKNGDN